jgi:D-alanyl-D-alanine carboxypeptidase (penicillin-binding protein 5/6)
MQLISKAATAFLIFTSLTFCFATSARPVNIPKAPEISAKGYLLIDATSGAVLVENNADEQLAPASLTKMMTSYIVGREIAAGNVALNDKVLVSENAWARNFPDSSKMFIEVGTYVTVQDLNRGIIIQSGNDACVAIAEHIAGSEDAFADLMNAYAEKLGMFGSNFRNSHGLPDPEHYTTPRDMALLAKALINDVPEEYAIYAEKEFTYNNIKQYNRNSLLWDRSLNVDGIKTGHTSEAGYSLVSSATRDDMRLIAVVMGTRSEQARKAESKKLLNYGFRFYETVKPLAAGETLVSQRVWYGDRENIDLGTLSDISVTIARGRAKDLKAEFELSQTLEAPVNKGDQVGRIHFILEGEDIADVPLVALHDVEQGGWFSRLIDYLLKLIDQILNR